MQQDHQTTLSGHQEMLREGELKDEEKAYRDLSVPSKRLTGELVGTGLTKELRGQKKQKPLTT